MIFDEVKEILAEQLDIDPETIEMTSNLQTDLGAAYRTPETGRLPTLCGVRQSAFTERIRRNRQEFAGRCLGAHPHRTGAEVCLDGSDRAGRQSILRLCRTESLYDSQKDLPTEAVLE